MTHDDFEPLLARAHAHAGDFLRGLPQRFVGARAGREEMIAALGRPLPQAGEDATAVLDLLASQAERGASACAAPRYFSSAVRCRWRWPPTGWCRPGTRTPASM